MATKVKPSRIKATGTPQVGYVPKYVDEDTFQWGAGGGGGGGDVSGPASSTDGNVVLFDGATGKVIKDSGVNLSSKLDASALSDNNYGGAWSGDTTHTPTKNAIYTKIHTMDVEIGNKAADNTVVKLSGNQTIGGTKTFSTSPVVPSKTTDATNTGTAIATEAQVYKKAEIVYATQAEYEALLPGAESDGKHYFIYEEEVGPTPTPPFTPGVNTLAYYPLDTTNTVNDLSGNGYDLTNAGNVTFSTYDGVDCAKFSDSSPAGLTNTSANIISGQYTYLAWIKGDNDMGSGNPRIFGGMSSFFIILEKAFDIIHPYFSSSSEGASYTSGWHLICFVGNATNGTYDTYKDGVYVSSTTGGMSGGATGIMIGANESNSSITGDRFCGYMSQVIWEDKQWTATEISDYYDATKANYGIS